MQASVHAGVASLQGSADAAWIAQARARAERVVGLVALDTSLLRPADGAVAAPAAEALPGIRVHFVRELEPRDPAELQALVVAAQRLAILAPQLGHTPRLQCLGHNDEPGSSSTNRVLRQRRANWLCERLREAGVTATALANEADDTVSNRPIIDARAASLRLAPVPEDE